MGMRGKLMRKATQAVPVLLCRATGENRTRGMRLGSRLAAAVFGLLLVFLALAPVAASTPAGTVITNQAVAIADGNLVVSNLVEFQVSSFTVNFAASPTSGMVPLTVNFTDLSNGSPVAWLWDFGDGQTSVEQNPSHVYTRGGTYPVGLTVHNGAGAATIWRDACITVSESPPNAAFGADPTDGQTPLTVAFTDLSSGNPTSWEWNFGDGGTSLEQNPGHVYTRPGAYTVTLWASNTAGTGSKTEPRYVVSGFTDVPRDYWAYGGIMGCLKADLVLGYPEGSYRPLEGITRDQIAVYLARAIADGERNVPEASGGATFPDVPSDYWAFKYVEYEYGYGIILGYPDGKFHPTTLVNRAQMAVFLARCLASPLGEQGLNTYTPPETPTFADVTPTNTWSWCYKHVEYVAAKGVTSGYPDGLYYPANTCTRDQLAVYLSRTFHLSM